MVMDYFRGKKNSNLIPQNILHVRHVPNPITFNISLSLSFLVDLISLNGRIYSTFIHKHNYFFNLR